MTTIRLYQHPFAAPAPQDFEAQSLGHWLLERYGAVPQVTLQLYAGEPSGETEISHSAADILACTAPTVTVLESPGDPASILVNIAISLVLSVVATLLTPKPQQPANVNRTQESPNNQLAGRENTVRLQQRVEDIYGTVKAIPSLMMPTYNKYINHNKVEYGYYCVGRGYYDISALKDGDSLLSDIPDTSAAVYPPFTSPNSGTPQATIGPAIIDGIVSVRRSNSVDGITLKAPDQLNLDPGLVYRFYPAGGGGGVVPASSFDTIYHTPADRRVNFNAVASVGQTILISVAPIAINVGSLPVTFVAATKRIIATGIPFNTVTVGGALTVTGSTSNDATYTIAARINAYTVQVVEALTDETSVFGAVFDFTADYSGTRTIAAVGDGYVGLTDSKFNAGSSLSLSIVTGNLVVNNGLTDWTSWVTLPDTGRSEVWVNVLAPNGMYKDNGGKSGAGVEYQLAIEQLTSGLVPTGNVETLTGSLSGATSTERAETLERITGWAGPARVRMRRTTRFDFDFAGTVVDEIKWADLYSVTPVSKANFGNKTTIHTVTKATARATSVKTRQLNCIASRRLPTYNGSTFSGAFNSTGLLVSGSISATSKVVDIIAAVSVDPQIGARDLATEVDMAQLWATQQLLDAWSASVGQFNYTFDSSDTSYEETVTMIANAAFCIAYRQNGKIRLAFDRQQSASTALFTHRNKKPHAESITRKFNSDAEYDGVEFVYQDPDTAQPETIRLPLSGSFTKLKKFEIPGIRNFTQAWYRANREYAKLLGQRITIETETTTDARALLPNSRVSIVDNTRFKSFDGEVVGQSGLTLTLSQNVAFIPATAHSIVLMKRDGSLQSISCTAGPAANQVVLASAPAEAVVTVGGAAGIATIFSFAADSARAAQAYLVQEIGTSDGQYIRIKAVNYSDDYYAADTATVPSKDSVINS